MKKFLFNFIKYGSLIAFILATAVLLFEAAMPGKQSANHSNQVGDAISGTLESIKGDNTKFTDVEKITVTNNFKTNNSYSIGDELSITTEITPNNASNKSLTFTSSNPEIISVDSSGHVEFLDEGAATITITSASNQSIKQAIKFVSSHVYPEEIVLEELTELSLNNTYNLNVELLPANTTKTRLTFYSSNEDIAEIDDFGNIKPLTTGTVTIKVKTENNLEKEITLNVVPKKDVEIEEINASDEISLYNKELALLEYQIYPLDTANKSVEINITDEDILSIEDGVIKGLKPGTTSIVIRSKQNSNVEKTITVNVLELPQATDFEIVNEMDVLVSEKFTISFDNITPHNADTTKINYSDYDENIISIKNNTLTALCVGATKLKVQLGSCTKEITINVIDENIIDLEDLQVLNQTSNLFVSEEYTLNVELTPNNATFSKLLYQSSDEDILEIDQSGNIKALKEGSATITVSSINYETITYSFTINVSNVLAKELDLNLDSTLYLGDNFTISTTITSNNSLEVTNQAITYSSSDTDILYIDETGYVSIKGCGEVTISAHLENQTDVTYFKTITIEERLVEAININKELTLYINKPTKLNYSVTPSNAYNTNLTYQTNNPNIISIDANGNINPLTEGTCVITVKSISNPKIKETINVTVKHIYPNAITINSDFGTTDKEIIAGVSKQINVLLNQEATYKKITYTSSNEDLAVIDENGLIVAKYPGKVTITASAFDGEKKIETSFELTINRQPAIANTQNFFYLVRKGIGHFGAFLCLALACTVMLMCFLQYHPATITLSALLGFIIAGATELIQLFTPGRSGNWTDVGIDYFGYAAGIFLIYIVVFTIKFIKFIRTTKKNKKDFNPYDLHGNMFNRHIK